MARSDESPFAVLGDLRDPSSGDLPELDFRFERIERGEHGEGLPQRLPGVEDRAAETRQDPLDLAPFFRSEEGELVVRLDDLHRLDEHGLSGAGPVVHDARHPRPRGGHDGDAVAVVAQDDERLVDELPAGVEDALELALDLPAAAPQAPADRGELRGRVVAQPAFRGEDRPRLLEETLEAREGVAPRGEARRLRRLEGLARGLRGACEREDGTELLRRSGAAALLELGERRGDVHDAGEGEAAVGDPEGPRLGGLGERLADFRFREPGPQLFDDGAAGRGAREIGREMEDDVELERAAFDVVPRETVI
jgi:hypothetical protein